MSVEPRVIVALDFPISSQALALAAQLDPTLCHLKVGKELFVRSGHALVERLIHQGYQIFLDLKFHDIPSTVAAACQAAAGLGVWMLDVHALGGRRMLEAAANSLAQRSQRPLLIAVTMLTSLTDEDLQAVGIVDKPQEQVLRLARLAEAAGLDGVVCSAQEASYLRSQLKAHFCLVTPGIRPAGSALDDQRRIMTPKEAIAAGADYVVVGRPITRAADPLSVLQDVIAQINGKCTY